jgi:hypothetical protein
VSSSTRRSPGRWGWLVDVGPRVSALLWKDGGRFLGASLGAAALAVVLRHVVAGVRSLKVRAGGSGAPLTGSGAGGA